MSCYPEYSEGCLALPSWRDIADLWVALCRSAFGLRVYVDIHVKLIMPIIVCDRIYEQINGRKALHLHITGGNYLELASSESNLRL